MGEKNVIKESITLGGLTVLIGEKLGRASLTLVPAGMEKENHAKNNTFSGGQSCHWDGKNGKSLSDDCAICLYCYRIVPGICQIVMLVIFKKVCYNT